MKIVSSKPYFIFQRPFDGLAEGILEIHRRIPAELPELRIVQRVSQIVSRPARMHIDMLRFHSPTCALFPADEFGHLQNVLVYSGDMKHTALTLLDKKENRVGVITRVEPVPGTETDVVSFLLHVDR